MLFNVFEFENIFQPLYQTGNSSDFTYIINNNLFFLVSCFFPFAKLWAKNQHCPVLFVRLFWSFCEVLMMFLLLWSCKPKIYIELTWSFAFMALSVIDSWQLAQVIISAILEKNYLIRPNRKWKWKVVVSAILEFFQDLSYKTYVIILRTNRKWKWTFIISTILEKLFNIYLIILML